MSNKKQSQNAKNSNLSIKSMIIPVTAIILLAVAIFIMNGNKGTDNVSVSAGGDIVIEKSEITETVRFYPTKVGKINMEVLAVKASDASIRTAFNTCQVCNGSPRAYYKQEGEIIICQNCGNQFSMDMIEVQRGGCNPIPIMSDEKIENGDTITIPKDFIAQNKGLFTENWKSQ